MQPRWTHGLTLQCLAMWPDLVSVCFSEVVALNREPTWYLTQLLTGGLNLKFHMFHMASYFPFWNYHSLGTVLIYCNKNLLCCGSVCCLPSVSSSRYHWVAGLYPAYTDIPYYFICTSWSNCSVYLFLYCPSWCIGEFQYCHLICSWSHYQYYLSLSFYLSLICIWSLGYYFRSHYPYFLWSGNRWCICWGLISELVIWKPTQLVFRTQLSQPCYAYLFYLVK